MNINWQEIVIREGGTRTGFTLAEWEEPIICVRIIRLTCVSCGNWAQYAVSHEMIENANDANRFIASVIEYLVRHMLSVNTKVRASLVYTAQRAIDSSPR